MMAVTVAGKQICKSTCTNNKRLAQKMLARWETAVFEGRFHLQRTSPPYFEDWANEFLTKVAHPNTRKRCLQSLLGPGSRHCYGIITLKSSAGGFERNACCSGQFHIYQTAADGTGNTSAVIVDDAAEYNPSFSPDGRYMIFQRLSSQSGAHFEIWAKAMFGDPKPFPVVQSEAAQPALSPDGKWLAYSSQQSGRPEMYVVPFRQRYRSKLRMSS